MLVLRRLYSKHAGRYLRNDPGISRRKEMFETPIQTEEDCDFEDLESDFMTVDKSYKEHLREARLLKEREKYLLVKQKYFKEKWPNFLTWQDKELIRYLHNKEPEEWTIEKLSEGFPALPEVIQKIIKGRWTKSNQSKILNHDKSVLQNWDNYKNGNFTDLPEDLKQHLNKFSDRRLTLHNSFIPSTTLSIGPKKGGEFSEIITSYQNLRNNTNEEISIEDENSRDRDELNATLNQTYKTKNRSRGVTLRQLEKDVARKAKEGRVSLEERLIIEQSGFNKVTQNNGQIIQLQPDEENLVKYTGSQSRVNLAEKKMQDVSHLIYVEKIKIPPDIYKKGYTYKMNDCFYDSDGLFLYRVPGMIQ
ncbi:putative neugrin-like protein DDB_G0288135 [Euwallacea similis]|uniref:putative neugrin-like protein DDB_G0288135 n=1 Tax=Euwallacea similis TaxID=1736056 RepID=UPI00344F88AB